MNPNSTVHSTRATEVIISNYEILVIKENWQWVLETVLNLGVRHVGLVEVALRWTLINKCSTISHHVSRSVQVRVVTALHSNENFYTRDPLQLNVASR